MRVEEVLIILCMAAATFFTRFASLLLLDRTGVPAWLVRLLKHVPTEFKLDVHHWLILHGRYTCIARKPRCGSCLIEDLCEFKDKTDP